MATTLLSGLNYEADGDKITFFGMIGVKLAEDQWAMNAFGGPALVKLHGTDTMMPGIRECIKRDVEAGNGDKVAMVLLAPTAGVVFYLEGMLTSDHLANATEGPDYIDIPDVKIDDRSFTVRILRELSSSPATADSEGNIL